MASYLDVVFWALVGGVFSLIGGIILILNRKVADKFSHLAAPFAAGALLGAAFFDILPEAIELNPGGSAFRWTVGGIIIFFLLEHYLHWFHHHHEHSGEKNKKPTVPFIIIGDTLHNAIDGVAIGAAFSISLPVGIVTTMAVAAHEIPQEIGDFGILLKSGINRMKVLAINVASALITLVTAVYTFYLGSQENLPLGAILALSAGLFIYIAASDLIPTIHEEAKGRISKFSALLLILGVLIVGITTDIAHDKLESSGAHVPENESHISE